MKNPGKRINEFYRLGKSKIELQRNSEDRMLKPSPPQKASIIHLQLIINHDFNDPCEQPHNICMATDD